MYLKLSNWVVLLLPAGYVRDTNFAKKKDITNLLHLVYFLIV